MMRVETTDRVVSMVLSSKRKRHLDPRYLKLLSKHEIENGVIDHSTEDLFLDLNRELGMGVNKPQFYSRRVA